MQIFAPYPSFIDISNCLDKKRLNKQKVEIYQILNCLSKGEYICDNCREPWHEYIPLKCKCKFSNPIKTPWYNHPATRMAENYELFFIDYALEIADSCLRLGYKDTLIPKIKAFKEIFKGEYKKPWYWGKEEFHSSHRAALLYKDFNYYSKFGWAESPIQKYWWPTKNVDKS